MTDRLAALGGRLELRSGPGGTHVCGTVPLPPAPVDLVVARHEPSRPDVPPVGLEPTLEPF